MAAIVQDATTRDVLMLGWMDAEALRRTLDDAAARGSGAAAARSTGARARPRATASASAQPPTTATATPLLVTVDQEGRGACHTGDWTCFHRRFGEPPT